MNTYATYGQLVLERGSSTFVDPTTASGVYSCRVMVNMDLDVTGDDLSNNEIWGDNFTIQNEDEFYIFSKAEFDKREKPLPDLYSIDSKLIYKVRYGEFLGKIARKFGVKIADIKRWNNLKNDNIKENQKLIIFPKRIPKN